MKMTEKNQHTILVEATRERKLGLLTAMGIELPSSTKLSKAALEQKLKFALDASQSYSKVIGDGLFDPSKLPIWSTNQGKSASEAVRRGNLHEARSNMMARLSGRENAVDLYENAFMDLRQTLMAFGSIWDQGFCFALLQDKDEEYAICVRVSPQSCSHISYSNTHATSSL